MHTQKNKIKKKNGFIFFTYYRHRCAALSICQVESVRMVGVPPSSSSSVAIEHRLHCTRRSINSWETPEFSIVLLHCYCFSARSAVQRESTKCRNKRTLRKWYWSETAIRDIDRRCAETTYTTNAQHIQLNNIGQSSRRRHRRASSPTHSMPLSSVQPKCQCWYALRISRHTFFFSSVTQMRKNERETENWLSRTRTC